jgi:hypothetical protein
MIEMFHQDQYSVTSPGGVHLLCGLLICIESNKAVEDSHQPVRMEARANQNLRLSKDHMQSLLIHSGTLEARGISDRAMVKKET